jgi:hypothetical protein
MKYSMICLSLVRPSALKLPSTGSVAARILEPAYAFATSKRIIIIRRGILGFHQDFKVINYRNITKIVFEHGIMFSKLHFTLQGGTQEPGEKKWLIGLKYKEALEFVRYVNMMEQKPVQDSRTGPF